jgi:hypothetical protein
MKSKTFILYLLTTLLMEANAMAENNDLVVEVKATKASYWEGETIILVLTLSNSATRELSIPFDYPNHLGIKLSCEDTNVTQSQFAPSQVTDYRIPLLRLSPHQTHECIFALNRFLSFKSPKEYRVKYSVAYSEHASKGDQKQTTHTAQGEITIKIASGHPPIEEIDKLGLNLEKSGTQKVREVIERLLWISDSKVIEYLVKASKIAPEASSDIILALEKFSDSREGTEAMQRVALSGDVNTIKTYFDVAKRKSVEIPDAMCATLLSSPDTGVKYVTLQYLIDNGDKKQAALVRSMVNDSNSEIKVLARKYVSQLQ